MRATPLLAVALALALGEALGLASVPCGDLWPLALGLSAATVLFGYGLNLRGWGPVATGLLGLAAVWMHLADRARILNDATANRGPFVCEAQLKERPRARGEWLSADLTAGGLDLRVIFRRPADALPAPGETWRFSGWLERKPPTDLSRRRLWVKGEGTEAVRVAPAPPHAPQAVAARIRADFSRRLGLGLGPSSEAADLNRAILLGERAGVDRATRHAFAAAGTTHVFAISGLHVMCVAGLLFGALVLLGVPVRLMAVPLVPLLWAYVFLIGSTPSAVRAAAMATICLFAPVFWRRADGLVAWSLVFIAVHLLHPLQLANVGSLLSFAVMLTLILFGRWYREVVPSRRGEGLALSLAAWAAGVPIVAVTFGSFTPGAVLANLVLLPAAAVSVGASALAVGASFVSATLAGYFNNAAALATSAMVGVSRVTAVLPGASRKVAPWSLFDCFAWYAVLLLLLYLIRSVVRRRRRTL